MNVFARIDKIRSKTLQDIKETKRYGRTVVLHLNLNSLLVKRQIDNPSPGAVTGGN